MKKEDAFRHPLFIYRIRIPRRHAPERAFDDPRAFRPTPAPDTAHALFRGFAQAPRAAPRAARFSPRGALFSGARGTVFPAKKMCENHSQLYIAFCVHDDRMIEEINPAAAGHKPFAPPRASRCCVHSGNAAI
ncbi:MAG: hypothetical protein VB021_09730 [Oscillospiraceae bacterium]|nr:hypothetical protein [Oscillospiraceae bacterium]